jgi:hypothetical protein
MRGVICNYAPVRFLPYRETEEFVNLGVVLFCPQENVFAYKLATRRYKRVSDFFPELDVKILKASIQGLQDELQQLPFQSPNQNLFSGQPWDLPAQISRFTELIRIREGLVHFGTPGTLLAENPQAALDQLYERFVARLFAKGTRYQETEMRKRLHIFLTQWKLGGAYKFDQRIGDDDFHFKMPFVHFRGDVAEKVIKPLDLNKDTPSEIYDHGGYWIERMRRLKQRNCMPRDVIFPIAYPGDVKKRKVAESVSKEIAELGIITLTYSDNAGDINRMRESAAKNIGWGN